MKLTDILQEVINEQKEISSKKIPKEAVLYVFRPETQYTCDKCVFSKDKKHPDSTKCKILGATESIKPFGSCGFWIHMDPHGEKTPEIPWIGAITKEQAGYDENKQGFSCKRCEYFDAERMDCSKVDKNSEGDTPGIIHPNACCNRWEADSKRSKKSTNELMDSFDD